MKNILSFEKVKRMSHLQQFNAVQVAADFDAVYDQFKKIVSGKPLEIETLTPLIFSAIRLVEVVGAESGDKGIAKKALVLRLLQRLIEESALSLDIRETIKIHLDLMGPAIIDALIDADKGLLLEKSKKIWKKLKLCCGGCCK